MRLRPCGGIRTRVNVERCMSWFRRENSEGEKLPKLENADRRVRTEGLWQKCEGCRQIIWKKDLEANWSVCPKCGFHFRVAIAHFLERAIFGDDFLREGDSARAQLAFRHEFVDEAHLQTRLTGNMLARRHHLERFLGTHDAWQTLRAAGARQKSDVDLGKTATS